MKTAVPARSAAWLLAAIAVVQAAPAAQPTDRPAFTIEALPSPAGADAASPRLTVNGERVILSWLEQSETRSTLKYAERTASGWSQPTVVVSSNNVVTNWADVPSVRALPDGSLVAHWIEKNSPDPEAYDLRVSRSRDRGKTWTAAPNPHRDTTKTQHGFASFFDAGAGRLGLVWLDGRETAGGKGAMTLRATEYVWSPPSGGAAEAQLKPGPAAGESVVAPRVCDCCPTAAVNTADGALVAFRNRTAEEVRDIYVSRYDGTKWSAPAEVHRDGWKISGCPVNGPSLAARGRDVAIAWFTAANGAGRALAAFSTDAGRTFAAPLRVDDEGSTGRVQVALLGDGAAAVSWVEYGKGPSQLKIRRIGRNGTRSPPTLITEGVGTQFPRMAAARGELLFAWTENSRGVSRVRTARAKL